jgi:hypothetical protein
MIAHSNRSERSDRIIVQRASTGKPDEGCSPQPWRERFDSRTIIQNLRLATRYPPQPPELPSTEEPDGLVRIVAALVNATQSPEIEVVTLLNTAPHDVDLTGWALLDTQKKRLPLSGVLSAGATRTEHIQQPLALSNKGGVITLVDEKGLKVHGVSYTKEQARHPGWTIVF